MTVASSPPAAPALRPGPLVARTVAVPDPGPLLARLPEHDALAWVRRGEGLVGWGVTTRIDTSGPNRIADAERAWRELVSHAAVRDEVGLPGTGPVAFGSFSFAPESAAGGSLVVPQVVLGRRGEQCWVTTISAGSLPPTAELVAIAADDRFDGVRTAWADGAVPGSLDGAGQVTFADGALPEPRWAGAVARAIERIGAGEVEKVVLARDLEATTERPVQLRWVLQRLAERYPGCWTFAVDGLLGATPEMLVRLEKGLVTSRVLAGTIRRTGDDVHDLALAASLARSSKDLEEHEYAVRSVAEALAPHCTSTNLPESPFVLHLANVMHLATDVTGVLADGVSSLALADALHPSAAVCGTPTAAAAAMIAELEGMDRDRYAGPVGWIDADGEGEWGIALRCARIDARDRRRLRLFAGCGIVAGSDPQAEVAESGAKLLPMRDALTD